MYNRRDLKSLTHSLLRLRRVLRSMWYTETFSFVLNARRSMKTLSTTEERTRSATQRTIIMICTTTTITHMTKQQFTYMTYTFSEMPTAREIQRKLYFPVALRGCSRYTLVSVGPPRAKKVFAHRQQTHDRISTIVTLSYTIFIKYLSTGQSTI